MGDFKIGLLNYKHGLSNSPEHRVWKAIKTRCLNKNNHKYPDYGGRGITVCSEWINNFSQFLKDMGKRPDLSYSIDRINVDGNYEPSNCKSSTGKEQQRNKRNTKYIETEWGNISLVEASEKSGINYMTLKSRIKYGYTGKDLFNKNSLRTNLPL